MAHKYISVLTNTVACLKRRVFLNPASSMISPVYKNVNFTNCRRYGTKIPGPSTTEKVLNARKHYATKKSNEIPSIEKLDSILSEIPQRLCIKRAKSKANNAADVTKRVKDKTEACIPPTPQDTSPPIAQLMKSPEGTTFVIASEPVHIMTNSFCITIGLRHNFASNGLKRAMFHRNISSYKPEVLMTSYQLSDEQNENSESCSKAEPGCLEDVNNEVVATSLFYKLKGCNHNMSCPIGHLYGPIITKNLSVFTKVCTLC